MILCFPLLAGWLVLGLAPLNQVRLISLAGWLVLGMASQNQTKLLRLAKLTN